MPFAQQSPINLRDPIYAELGDEGLRIEWKGKSTGLVLRDDHGVKVEILPDNPQTITLGGHRYRLTSFHFHHPSEHLIDGDRSPMELHFVHWNVDDGTKFAVVSVFLSFSEDAPENAPIVKFLAHVAGSLNVSQEQPADNAVTIDPTIFLPERRGDYYRYEGSLTTPDFTENVSWAVMARPLELRESELSNLISVFKKPARLPQPLDRRFVLASFREDESAAETTRMAASSPKKRARKR